MRKFFFALAAIAAGFIAIAAVSSCQKDQEELSSLVGTTWTGTITGTDIVGNAKLVFTESTCFGVIWAIWSDGEEGSESAEMPYTKNGNIVILYDEGDPFWYGTIEGNRLTMSDIEDGLTMILTKV